jgi:ribosome-binding protein aMBF1 (putative translation factor)
MQGFQQDWDPIRIQRPSGGGGGGGRSNGAVASKTPGQKVARSTLPSVDAGHLRKLEEADAPIKLKRLTPQSRQEIVTRRTAAGWNQTQLNQQCLFPVNTIREIEAGRLTPNTQQLNTLNRVLKTGLKLEAAS